MPLRRVSHSSSHAASTQIIMRTKHVPSTRKPSVIGSPMRTSRVRAVSSRMSELTAATAVRRTDEASTWEMMSPMLRPSVSDHGPSHRYGSPQRNHRHSAMVITDNPIVTIPNHWLRRPRSVAPQNAATLTAPVRAVVPMTL